MLEDTSATPEMSLIMNSNAVIHRHDTILFSPTVYLLQNQLQTEYTLVEGAPDAKVGGS